ncbi:MAG TPA: hypothetical protein VMH90_04785 [Thermoplasmata archaeon]|nr:hypothetical protein [Thermoplasmata archaeon]
MAGSQVARASETRCARCGHRLAVHVRVPPAGAAGPDGIGRMICTAPVPLTLGGSRLCGCSLV